MKTTILFDSETTGLCKAESSPLNFQPYITEMYAIKIDEDFNIIDTYHQMFKVPIDVEVVQPGSKKSTFEITGISNAMLADKKPFIAHWKEIAQFFAGADIMVAHNVTYDRDCLKYELMRIGKLLNFPWPMEHQCTIEQSMSYKGFRLNLGKLHEHLFGEAFEGAHRAQSDVEALFKCYRKMHEKPKEKVEEVKKEENDKPEVQN